jgi:multidrug resistance protein, MATE family
MTVWLGTDWDKEVEKGIARNKEETKRRMLHDRGTDIEH